MVAAVVVVVGGRKPIPSYLLLYSRIMCQSQKRFRPSMILSLDQSYW